MRRSAAVLPLLAALAAAAPAGAAAPAQRCDVVVQLRDGGQWVVSVPRLGRESAVHAHPDLKGLAIASVGPCVAAPPAGVPRLPAAAVEEDAVPRRDDSATAPDAPRREAKPRRRAPRRERGKEPARRRRAPATRPAPGAARAAPAAASVPPPLAAPLRALTQTALEGFDVPPALLPIYHAAALRYGVPWEILAAVNEIETHFGAIRDVSPAGAVGPMQFMPATWRAFGVDADGDRRRDPRDPADAIFAAARYLRASGAPADLRAALFAYNHADWYVDSVLTRARRLGAMPAELHASLTHLLRGQFPVYAPARFARRGDGPRVVVRTAADAPVIATHDGTIVRIGRSAEHGHYVVLRTDLGHEVALSRLGRVVRRTPGMATAEPGRTIARAQVTVRKERLFAHPQRPKAYRNGGAEQLLRRADVAVFAPLRSHPLWPGERAARSQRLRPGARVLAGTLLGRAGDAGRVSVEIRPAGARAERVAARPFLDAWRALHVATGRADRSTLARFSQPTADELMLMPARTLRRRVLDDPRVSLYACGRDDVRDGRVGHRVLATLEHLASVGLHPTVTSLRCGHGYLTASGNVSHHSSGNAVDIAAINGTPILGHQGAGTVTDTTIRRLLELDGVLRPAQIVSLMSFAGIPSTLALADHADHVHVGFDPAGARRARPPQAADWARLAARL